MNNLKSFNTCPNCDKTLEGIFNPYCKEWHCSNCATDKKGVLHAERGCKVIFAHPNNGYDGDQQFAARYLVPNTVYTVDTVSIGQSSSTIELQEFPNRQFNTVLFERVE